MVRRSTPAPVHAGNLAIDGIAITMPRRRATVDQASIARALRAAKQAGASAVEVQQPDGAIIRILVNSPPLSPEQSDHSTNRDIIL
jgi:hypothetical protein